MISEHLMREETLEGPLFESLFNQSLNDEQFEGPSVLAGMPSVDRSAHNERKSLPLPGKTTSYPLPPQLQPPYNHESGI
jgi:cell division protease FtsH